MQWWLSPSLQLPQCCWEAKRQNAVRLETAKVEKDSISASVTATGTVEAVTSVDVGTQVSGIVTKLYVDYNSVVKKGQVIAELDKSNLQSQLTTAQENLGKARAEVQSQQANVRQQRAALQSAQASLNYQKSNYNRYSTLYHKGLVSANDYENARLTYQQAAKQVAQCQQQVASAQTQVASAQTQVGTAQEGVKQAQTNLGYATLPLPSTALSSPSRSRKARPWPRPTAPPRWSPLPRT